MAQPSSSSHPGQMAERTLRRVTIAVAIAPLLMVSAILFYAYDIIYRSTVMDHLASQVARHAHIMDRFLHECTATLSLEASRETIEKLQESLYVEERLTALNTAFGQIYTDLGLLDPQGNQVSYAGPSQYRRPSYADETWYAQARTQEHFISDVALGSRRRPHFFVTIRHVDATGAPWLLRGVIDFEQFNARVRELRRGETGKAFIVNRQGVFQTDAGDASSIPGDILSQALKMNHTATKPTLLEGTDGRGIAILAWVAPLKGGQWLLIFQQERFETLRPLYLARFAAMATVALGIIAIVTVTHLAAEHMERRLGQALAVQERLQQQIVEHGKLAAIGQLAAGVAHEINNPVAIMMENAGWIQDLIHDSDLQEADVREEILSSAHEILSQGRRCRDITHSLLNFSRKTETPSTPIALSSLVEEVVNLLRPQAHKRGISITAVILPTPRVLASPTEIQQVLFNLITNAMDAITHTHGAVTVRLYSQKDSVVLEVHDNGQGIPREHQEHIFEPFFTTKPAGKGTGLGLAICAGIVRRSGGVIEVHSKPGAGATFRVILPAAPQEITKTPDLEVGGTSASGASAAHNA